jgi:hypothetical protein
MLIRTICVGLAAAAVPPAVAEVIKIIVPVSPTTLCRRYSQMLFAIDGDFEHPAEVFFYDDPAKEESIFNAVCMPGKSCLWVSRPTTGIPIPADKTLIIDLKVIDSTYWPHAPGKIPNPPNRGQPGRTYRNDVSIADLKGHIMLVGDCERDNGSSYGFSSVYQLPIIDLGRTS